VRFGAQAVCAEQSTGPAIASVPPPRQRGAVQMDLPEIRRSGFWDWVKAAF
jgi:hypothetical protein